MEKTQLGININFFAAGIYLTALIGGIIPTIILVGYTLFFERNEWLRKVCVRSLIVVLCFSAASIVVGMIPDLFNTFNDISNIFGGEVPSPKLVVNIVVAIKSILSLAGKGVLIFLAYTAVRYKDYALPVIDDVLTKSM